jgi:Kef-type K+ transport system membrane component KefB
LFLFFVVAAAVGAFSWGVALAELHVLVNNTQRKITKLVNQNLTFFFVAL